MSVNGIYTNAYSSYETTNYTTKANSANASKKPASKADTASEAKGVTYESSAGKMTEQERTALVQKLKADTESRLSNLKSLVTKMFLKQGQKVQNSDDIWSMLASGNFTVDPETAAKAKEEISEDGYWGVNQTSDRIFEMAKALSGGDAGKMDKMLDAFKKGFDEATKAWGKSLPDISQKTYDAVMKKFEDFKNGVEA